MKECVTTKVSYYLLPEREIGSSWSPLHRKLTHDLCCLHGGVKGISISSFKYGIYSAGNFIRPQPKQNENQNHKATCEWNTHAYKSYTSEVLN